MAGLQELGGSEVTPVPEQQGGKARPRTFFSDPQVKKEKQMWKKACAKVLGWEGTMGTRQEGKKGQNLHKHNIEVR